MASVNKVILIGNLGRDPEVRKTSTGKTVANFSLATTEYWTDKNGERREDVSWHSCTVWSTRAEVAEKYLRKGMEVFIEGRISYSTWDDQDGNKKKKTEIVVTNIQILTKKEKPQGNYDDNQVF